MDSESSIYINLMDNNSREDHAILLDQSGDRPGDCEVLVVLQAVEIARLGHQLERLKNELHETYKLNFQAHSYEVQIRQLTDEISRLNEGKARLVDQVALLEDRLSRERARLVQENVRVNAELSASRDCELKYRELQDLLADMLREFGASDLAQQKLDVKQARTRMLALGKARRLFAEEQTRCLSLEQQISELNANSVRLRQEKEQRIQKLTQINTHLVFKLRDAQARLSEEQKDSLRSLAELAEQKQRFNRLEQEKDALWIKNQKTQSERAIWEGERKVLSRLHLELKQQSQQSRRKLILKEKELAQARKLLQSQKKVLTEKTANEAQTYRRAEQQQLPGKDSCHPFRTELFNQRSFNES